LASHVLGRIARRLSADWQAKYGHPIHLLETFVDTSRFSGVCYRAANWRMAGVTTGRTRQNKTQIAQAAPKAVWLYPLRKDFREVLCAS
jgi:transposase